MRVWRRKKDENEFDHQRSVIITMIDFFNLSVGGGAGEAKSVRVRSVKVSLNDLGCRFWFRNVESKPFRLTE